MVAPRLQTTATLVPAESIRPAHAQMGINGIEELERDDSIMCQWLFVVALSGLCVGCSALVSNRATQMPWRRSPCAGTIQFVRWKSIFDVDERAETRD